MDFFRSIRKKEKLRFENFDSNTIYLQDSK